MTSQTRAQEQPDPGLAVVVMAGGVGERFWPASRKALPKPFMAIGSAESMIVNTYDRVRPLVAPDRFMVVTARDLVDAFRETLPDVPPGNILGEPVGRNTAPCVAYAAVAAEKNWGKDTVLITMAADHHIRDVDRFREVLRTGVNLARPGDALVTMGIVPDRPDTGFGYIRAGEPVKTGTTVKARKVRQFIEKPDAETALGLMMSGEYLWNSGMFIWSVKAIRAALDRHMPEMSKSVHELREALGTPNETLVLDRVYPTMPRTPIDKGVMEKAGNVIVLDGDFGWDDIGTWPALQRICGKDREGNTIQGEHAGLETEGCIICSDEGLVATFGVENLVIVRSGNAVLVCSREKAGDLKRLIAEIAKREELGKFL